MHFDPGRHAWPGGPEHWNPSLYGPAPLGAETDGLAAFQARERQVAADFERGIAGQDLSAVVAAIMRDEDGFRTLGAERCRDIWVGILAGASLASVEDLVVLTGGSKPPLSRYNKWSETNRFPCWPALTDTGPDHGPAWLDARGYLWKQSSWYPDGRTFDTRACLRSHYYNNFHPESVSVVLPRGSAVRTTRSRVKRYGQRLHFLVVSDAVAVDRWSAWDKVALPKAITAVLGQHFRSPSRK